MKISALVTTLALGLSSVAVAAPNRPVVRDHRAPIVQPQRPLARPAVRPIVRPAVRPWTRPAPVRWTVLDTASTRGKFQVINVSSRQRFSTLKLEATRGAALIDRVMITFGNGRTQTIDLDRRIGGNSAPYLIDLSGDDRYISRIVVVTKGRTRAAYTVSAS